MNNFRAKNFALKSKMKNFKIFRMRRPLKCENWQDRAFDQFFFFFGEFADFHTGGPPAGLENLDGTRSVGGGAVNTPPL